MWWLLAQASQTPTIDLGPAIQQIGIGVLIAAPMALLAWLLFKRNDKLQSEKSALEAERVDDQKAQVMRERELVERLGPLLAEAVKILATAPDRFEKTLNQAQTAIQRTEVENLIHKLEASVEGIAKDRGQR